jgi:hypothetical protein
MMGREASARSPLDERVPSEPFCRAQTSRDPARGVPA